MLDPVPQLILRAAMSLLFAAAAVHKLRDVDGFRRALEGYELLPPLWAVPAGAALIAVELSIALALWLPALSTFAAVAAATLLGLYAAAIAVNLLRGRRDIECGCFGPARRRPISAMLVVRNALLAAAALGAAAPAEPRPLLWIDLVTIAAGVLGVALLYLAIDGLLALSDDAARRAMPIAEVAHD
jgi:hypothetical protein